MLPKTKPGTTSPNQIITVTYVDEMKRKLQFGSHRNKKIHRKIKYYNKNRCNSINNFLRSFKQCGMFCFVISFFNVNLVKYKLINRT